MSPRPSPRVPKSQDPIHASQCPRPLVPVPVLYTAVSNAFSQFYLFPRPVKIRCIWRLAGPDAGAAANVARPDGPEFG